MLKKDKILVLFCFILFCCTNQEIKIIQVGYVEENFESYQDIYDSCVDSIYSWKTDSLGRTKPIFFGSNWQLDSMIIFNRDSTRMFTYLNISKREWKNTQTDALDQIGGAKINDKWYFFFMNVYTVLDRASYQDSAYIPLTFEELSYLARQNMLNVMKKDKNGNYHADESFFQQNFYDVVTKCPKGLEQKICVDSVVLSTVRGKYQYKLDSKEIQDIKKKMTQSKRPPEPKKEERSWWDRTFNPEKVKIFESEEWKNRHKKKNEGK